MKVGGALLAGYWPPEVARRAPVPQLPLPALVRRSAATAKSRPAVVAAGGTLTYRELDDLARSAAASLRGLELESPVVGLAEEDGKDALVLLLGALEAGCQVAILDPGEPPGALAERLRSCGASTVITWSRPGRAAELPARLVRGEELSEAKALPSGAVRPAPPRKPAVMLPTATGLAVHSHFSLTAMATALTNFVPRLRSLDFLASGSVFEWETLTGTLGALLSGRTVGFGPPASGALDPVGAYTILRRQEADAIGEAGGDPAGWGQLRYVFVSVGPFSAKWRRRLEAALGRSVLPLWGSADVGPAVGAHPTWYPVRAHGIPLVNVTLVPVDPSTGLQSEVPWAMLAQAELGVDAPSTRVGVAGIAEDADPGLAPPALEAESASRSVLRTSAIVEIDSVGVVRFLA